MLHYITLLFHSAVVEVQAWTGLREPSAAPGNWTIQICWIIAWRECLLIRDEDLKNQWRCSRGGLQAASPPPLGVWQVPAILAIPTVCVLSHPTPADAHPLPKKSWKMSDIFRPEPRRPSLSVYERLCFLANFTCNCDLMGQHFDK